jgi:hypothetical protein
MPLVPQVTLQYFDKWVVYFVGMIYPPTKTLRSIYIINTIDYLIGWDEAEPTRDCNTETNA